MDMITAKQIKAGRALAGWRQRDLAEATGLAEITIRVVERGETDPRSSTLQKIQQAFMRAGVVFTPEGVEKKN
jgi:transcriptional regulator with XRE-family HTH domain